MKILSIIIFTALITAGISFLIWEEDMNARMGKAISVLMSSEERADQNVHVQDPFPCQTGSGPILLVPNPNPGEKYEFLNGSHEWYAYCKTRYAVLHQLRNQDDTPLRLPTWHPMWVPGVTPAIGRWEIFNKYWMVRKSECQANLKGPLWTQGLSVCTILVLADSNTGLTKDGRSVIRRIPQGNDLVSQTNIFKALNIKYIVLE